MKRSIVIVLSVLMMQSFIFPGLSKAQGQTGTKQDEGLKERVKALEERLDKLDRVEVIKQVREYICPGGEIHDALPPGGHCPNGEIPEARTTFRKLLFSRRESIADKIEAALEDAESSRVAVGGSARGILQQLVGSEGEDKLFSTASVDIFVLSRPMTRATFFVDFETIGGAGPDEVLGSLSRLNTDAETLGVSDTVKINEAWLHKRLLKDRLIVVVGKLDLTNYFDQNEVANDETSQFLNTALVNNPVLRPAPNGPGLAVRYEPSGGTALGFGLQSSDGTSSGIGAKIYALAEIAHRSHLLFSREGNVRLWVRTGRVEDDLGKKTYGAGISFDQQVGTRTRFFVRAALGKTKGEAKKEHAWSTGFEVKAPFSAPTRDRVGVGFSRQRAVARSESLGEAYYHHFFTDRISAAFDLQWLFSGINSITGEKNRNIVIPGFRTTIDF